MKCSTLFAELYSRYTQGVGGSQQRQTSRVVLKRSEESVIPLESAYHSYPVPGDNNRLNLLNYTTKVKNSEFVESAKISFHSLLSEIQI